MADEPQDETLSIQIANQIINVANARLKDGIAADEIAAGLRHAAANFSAYAASVSEDRHDPNALVEEFVRFLEFYLTRHESQQTPGTGLHQLIKQVKEEF